MREEAAGTRLQARFRTHDATLEADVFAARPPGHETLNVVIPWSDTRFQFTSKQNCRPAHGTVVLNGETVPFGPTNHAFACLDYGRGVWPYRCVWNWGSASGVQGGRRIGITLGGQWTDGTGMTENGILVDNRLHKIGEDVVFTYDRTDWMKPWRLRTRGSDRIDLTLVPFFAKAATINLLLLRSELHVLFGRFSGTITTDDGERIPIADLIGWSEEHRARW
jgi:hypothetical protein